MSYTTWHNYGYGICVDDIKTRDVTRLESMLKLAPNLDREIHRWLEECSISEPVWDDYMEFDQDFMLGLATILQKVIEDASGAHFAALGGETESFIAADVKAELGREGKRIITLSGEERKKMDRVCTEVRERELERMEKEGVPEAKRYVSEFMELMKSKMMNCFQKLWWMKNF